MSASGIPPAIRQQVLDRDNNQCVVCGGTWRLELHHVVYRSQGGRHTETNLATLCQGCHRHIHNAHIVIEFVETTTGEWMWFTRRLR